MATSASPTPEDLRSAVELAVRAPSIHNTQPWRWVLRADGMDLYADRSRQLAVADPDGHALMVSCGAALQLARLGLAAAGWATDVQRSADSADPDLLAHLNVTGAAPADAATQEQVAAAQRRHSDRRPFADRPVDEDLLESLQAAVDDDGVHLHVVARSDEALDLAVLVNQADRAIGGDAAYEQELAQWVRTQEAQDGIPATAVPHLTGSEPRHTDVPIRNFEAGITGALPVAGGQDEKPALTVIMTAETGSLGSLRGGEALARLLVATEAAGLSASIISQPVDWPVLRERMRGLMAWREHPQILVRIGWPSDDDVRLDPTPRRTADEVIDEQR